MSDANAPPTDEVATTEACIALRIPHHKLYQLMAAGRLDAFRRGRCWFISRASLDAELERMKSHSAKAAR